MKLSDFVKNGNLEEKEKEDINKKYEELKDLSHDELLLRLKSEIERQKEAG